MINENELFELEDRYCPICGNFIKINSSLHRCDDEYLKKLRKLDKIEEDEKEKDRTYDDKLKEFEDYYNPETYYDKNNEE